MRIGVQCCEIDNDLIVKVEVGGGDPLGVLVAVPFPKDEVLQLAAIQATGFDGRHNVQVVILHRWRGAYEARAAGDRVRFLIKDKLVNVEVVVDLLSRATGREGGDVETEHQGVVFV